MLPWILNFMKGEYHNLSVNLSFNPIIFVVAGIFSAITVWVSIKKPFKIAATISPIEATRYYEKTIIIVPTRIVFRLRIE